MNRIIISIVLLAVMAAGCFGTIGIVHGFTDRLISKIDEVEQAFLADDTEKSSIAAEKLQQEWHSFMDYALLVNDLGHSLEITSAIAQICSFAGQDSSDSDKDLSAACDNARALIEVFRDMQTPTLWKIL